VRGTFFKNLVESYTMVTLTVNKKLMEQGAVVAHREQWWLIKGAVVAHW
jgi:hypothetical protein